MRWSAAAILLALVLSGCSGTDPENVMDDPTTSPPTGGALGSIEVRFNRTTVDGPVPLRVDFTLDATFKDANGTAEAKPAAAVSVTYRRTEDANGAAQQGTARNGPSVTSLPATFSLTFDQAGKYLVVATVKSAGHRDGQASIEVLPRVAGDGDDGPAPVFLDGGEGDTSQWTLSSNVTYIDFEGIVPTIETPAPHPGEGWTISDAEAHAGAKSFYSGYQDNYRARMVSLPIDVPGDGGRLSFWYKGGAEANCCDGLFVLVNGEERLFTQGPAKSWTQFATNVPGGEVVLEFRMDADASCSNESGLGAGCGEGWDLGGFYVDDITVA